MKNITIILVLAFTAFVGKVSACPVWTIGFVKIVDEQGKDLPNAILWRKYSSTDSFKWSKFRNNNQDSIVEDSNRYRFTTGGYPIRRNTDFESYYRIHCDGYADVIIKVFNFKIEGKEAWKLGLNQLPVIKVVMYRPRFLQKGDYFIKMDEFVVDKVQAKSDTTSTDISMYTLNIKEESSAQTKARVAASKYQTYPNPVKDVIRVEIRDTIHKAFKASIFDLQGKLIKEQELTETMSSIDMQFESSGTYYIRVCNSEGEMKHCMRFIKE